MMGGITLTKCLHCGKDFHAHGCIRFDYTLAKYCSRECWDKSPNKIVINEYISSILSTGNNKMYLSIILSKDLYLNELRRRVEE